VKDFLRKMQLPEYAVEIYLKSLGKFPLSFYELYTLIPKATPEEFNDSIKQLLDVGLLIQQKSKKQENIIHYSPLPPILPILNYYENINANLTAIKKSIYDLMVNSLSTMFQENKVLELDSIVNTFQEIKKDIDEDSIIQKQEVEDIVEGMEELKHINKKLSGLHQNIKSITQTKFADLFKTINILKADIISNINSMEFKKHKEEILALVEKLFKEKLDKMVEEFTNNLHELIEKEFDSSSEPIKNTIESIFQYRNDFKILLLNMLTNFESKMNKIYELLKENQEELIPAMKNLEIKIIENLNSIVQNSINQVSNLNKPIETVMKQYIEEMNRVDKQVFNNVWIINSVTKINESIHHLITNSKENLTLIIPHIENHLALEQFDKITGNLKVKIASSEAHTNSIVKSFNDIKNIVYRNYQNDNIIILKSDSDIFILGIIQDSNNTLDDFIGIGTSFKPLIKLLDPLIKNIWEEAYSDSFHATQITKTQAATATTHIKSFTAAKPIIPAKFQSNKGDIKSTKIESKPTIPIPSKIQEISKEDKRSTKISAPQTPVPSSSSPKITDLKQKLQEKIEFLTAAQPKAGDEAGILINTAFNHLIDKLGSLKGDAFGKELQDIADLILEKKGFSVTLHSIRSTINKYKEKLSLLGEYDKKEIIESIEGWKKRLF